MKHLKDVSTMDLIKELTNRGYFRYYWHEDDITSILYERGYDYTDQDVREIKSRIQNNIDQGGPLTFQLIEDCIGVHFNFKNLKS